VDETGALRPKFDKDFDTEQNSDRDVFWQLSRWVGQIKIYAMQNVQRSTSQDAPGIDATALGKIARPPTQAST
jgi:hypothetical protein